MAVHSPSTPGALPEFSSPLSQQTRRQLEALVEQLIGILDHDDGDTDLEPNGDDESSLGGMSGDDRELDTSDDELSLGWSIPSPSTGQGPGYTAFCTDELEQGTREVAA